MSRFAILLVFVILSNYTFAQDWTDAEIKKANTAEKANYLSTEEKNIILYMNLIRLDGEKFYYTFLQDYIDTYNANVRKYRNYNELKITKNNSYYTSLLKNLKGVKNLSLFYPDAKLTAASRSHAMDLSRNNIDTHESSNGDNFSKRLSRYFPNKLMTENIDFGYSKSLDIVCHLLLDCGVPSLGHRYNILDQKYKFNIVGVNIQPHPSFNYCTVIDFVAQPTFYAGNQ
ncbi:CAP domain-containing protein [Pedobacter punctiformis]|uniref:CAP domain-containing protein n=1 Tax=Pedobacter punctiformis TaxID=3004097 RepID=A0ABT4L9B1_9SPHI|nr:CAP domain-containing protein [Pedobacter sp. HCMS5-2]MCZ4244507.1 CAP domain-containing protein [Pedobacter sp. HCMS5-2]